MRIWPAFLLIVGASSLVAAASAAPPGWAPPARPRDGVSESPSQLGPLPASPLAPRPRLPFPGPGVLHVPGGFATIQAALDAAAAGDTVLVEGGNYTGAGNKNLSFGGKDIVLISNTGLFGTTIRCEGDGRAIDLSGGETNAAVIDGFVLRDGNVTGSGSSGGGIRLSGSSPTIRNCYLFNDQGVTGGGIACANGSSPLIENTILSSNTATGRGGGIHVDSTSSVTMSAATIQNNSSGIAGGGVSLDGGPVSALSSCRIIRNSTSGSGGGLACEAGAALQLIGCFVQGNDAAGLGGGVFADVPSGPLLTGTVIAGNHAGSDGGGLYAEGLSSLSSCTFADNASDGRGGGLLVDVGGELTIDRSIVWANCASGGGDQVWAESGTVLDLTCGLVDDSGLGGPGTILPDGNTTSTDPMFCLPACCAIAPIYDINGFIAATYTLDPSSPALAASSPCGQLIGARGEGCPPALNGSHLQLLSRVPPSAFACGLHTNDIWGYASPSGREYAIVGLAVGTGFVEVTDPAQPVVVAVLPDAPSLWSDMATFGEYAYNVNENGAGGDGVQIFDLHQIDAGIVSFVGSFTGSGFTDAHNISINETSGFAYLSLPGILGADLLLLDLADPENPTIAAAWADATGARVHDCQVVTYDSGPYVGREIGFLAAEGAGVYIVDFTDKSNILILSNATYPDLAYCHQLWVSDDRRYLFVDDEEDELQGVATTTTYVFDIQDLEHPFLHGVFTSGLPSTDHNLIVRGDFVYEANYTSGLRVFDVSDIDDIAEVAYYDTYPESDAVGFAGAWGIYPLLPSGTILVSDMIRGLFVFGALPVEVGPEPRPSAIRLHQNYPNPSHPNAKTTFRIELPFPGRARLEIYDVAGRRVRTLVDTTLPAGSHEATWDGTDQRGSPLPSGTYLTRLRAGGQVLTQKSVLLE